MVAIGAWAAALSAIYHAVTPAEREGLAALGVCAELAGVFIGESGRPLPTRLDSRMIVTPGPALQLLYVAYGVAKSPAVFAAIRGGLVHGLVIHASLARALHSLASQRSGP